MTSAADLTIPDLLSIASAAGVFKIMGTTGKRVVKIDYVPPRNAQIVARDHPTAGSALAMIPSQPIEITYVLEDGMFGGVVYAALTCGGRVLVHPFVWENYDKLAATAVPVKS